LMKAIEQVRPLRLPKLNHFTMVHRSWPRLPSRLQPRTPLKLA
jgi:hypothetical protein